MIRWQSPPRRRFWLGVVRDGVLLFAAGLVFVAATATGY